MRKVNTLVGQTRITAVRKSPVGGLALLLSGTTVEDNAAVGTVIGTLSVMGGHGTYTHTITSDPSSQFTITSNSFKVNGALTAGSYTVGLRANNGAGSIINKNVVITVTVATAVPDSDPYPVIF
jgi:hypothetical protein